MGRESEARIKKEKKKVEKEGIGEEKEKEVTAKTKGNEGEELDEGVRKEAL